MAIVLRLVKGSKLTHVELDGNFTFLLNEMLSKSGLANNQVYVKDGAGLITPITISEEQILGRLAGGEIKGLTKYEITSLIDGLDADSIDDTASTHKFITAGEIAKLAFMNITQSVDMDAIEARVNALDAAVVLKGTWSAVTGVFPTSLKSGESWIISTAGTIGGVVFNINDRLIALVDGASTTVYAGNWHKADYTDEVLSVAGRTGAVTLTVADLVGMTASTAELNHLVGVLSPIQAQLDEKEKEAIEIEVTTARTTAVKIGTTIGGSYTPVYGDKANVKFTLGCSANTITLNVDGSGAKNIKLGGVNVGTTLYSTAAVTDVLQLFYDGSSWNMYGSQKNDNTTYSVLSTGEIDAGSSNTPKSISGVIADYIISKAKNLFSNSLWAARGDMIIGSGSGTAAKLSAGSNGQMVVYDNAEATGMKKVPVYAEIGFYIGIKGEDLVIGDKDGFTFPYAFEATAVLIAVKEAPAGLKIIADAKKNGSTSIFGTKPSIDIAEKNSTTAAVAYTLTTTTFAIGDTLGTELTQVGSTPGSAGKDFEFWLIGYRIL